MAEINPEDDPNLEIQPATDPVVDPFGLLGGAMTSPPPRSIIRPRRRRQSSVPWPIIRKSVAGLILVGILGAILFVYTKYGPKFGANKKSLASSTTAPATVPSSTTLPVKPPITAPATRPAGGGITPVIDPRVPDFSKYTFDYPHEKGTVEGDVRYVYLKLPWETGDVSTYLRFPVTSSIKVVVETESDVGLFEKKAGSRVHPNVLSLSVNKMIYQKSPSRMKFVCGDGTLSLPCEVDEKTGLIWFGSDKKIKITLFFQTKRGDPYTATSMFAITSKPPEFFKEGGKLTNPPIR